MAQALVTSTTLEPRHLRGRNLHKNNFSPTQDLEVKREPGYNTFFQPFESKELFLGKHKHAKSHYQRLNTLIPTLVLNVSRSGIVVSREQQRSQLPTFGNWENGDSVAYTAYFETARKGKGHAKRNPNGVRSDHETYMTSEPSTRNSSSQKEADPSQKVAEPEAATSKQKHYRSGDEADRRRPIGSPLHHGAIGGKTNLGASRPYNSGVRKPKTEAEQVMKAQDVRRRSHDYRIRAGEYDHRRRRFSDSTLHRDPRYGRVAAESPVHRDGGMSSPNRSVWQNPRSEHVVSSSHGTQHRASVWGGGGQMSSPVQEPEKRYSSTSRGHSTAPMTPGRSRLKPVARGDKTSNHSTSVPKFGDWDETNPSSADGYTHVFNLVVEEKKDAAGKAPVTTAETPHSNAQYSRADTRSESRGCRCFPWRGRWCFPWRGR